MFRASKVDRKWHAVDLPSPLSVGGNFARQPPSSRAVYYVVSSIAASSEFQRCRVPGAAHGIYRTLDQGRSWTCVAAGLFGQLVITEDQKLYATVLIPEKKRAHGLIVQVSEDTGRSWRELHRLSGVSNTRIFLDPDHPNLVCIADSNVSFTTYLQAEDDRYAWKRIGTGEWDALHQWTEEAFWRDYRWSNDAGLIASPRNYFSEDFGDQPALSKFGLATKPQYVFSVGQRHIIEVEFRVRIAAETFILNDEPLNDIRFAAKHTRLGWRSASWTASREEMVKPEHVQISTPLRIPVSAGNPYRRKVNLDHFVFFERSGTYLVQLRFVGSFVERGEDPSMPLLSPPFRVTIQ